jgi:hypothetical protein
VPVPAFFHSFQFPISDVSGAFSSRLSGWAGRTRLQASAAGLFQPRDERWLSQWRSPQRRATHQRRVGGGFRRLAEIGDSPELRFSVPPWPILSHGLGLGLCRPSRARLVFGDGLPTAERRGLFDRAAPYRGSGVRRQKGGRRRKL